VALLVSLAAVAPVARGAQIHIVQDGAARATIVVARTALEPGKDDRAAQKVATAARELQQYLEQMSGAKLPIVGDDVAPAGALILVGRSTLADALGANIPSGLTPNLREEGFVVLARGDRLLLAGNDAGHYHGTEYAVYYFLRTLGVRWYMPGTFGEVVPKRPSINVDLEGVEVRQGPSFHMRNWWGHTDRPDEIARWKLRNFMNPDGGFALPGDSSVRNFVADAALVGTEPELFARNFNGTVNPYLPNLTNPRAVQIAADKMKAILRNAPGTGSIGIAPDDGIPRDFNPDTVKRNQGFTDVYGREGVPSEFSMSEEWFEFVNGVAALVKQEFPDVIVTTNGYANRNTPPQGVTLDPNLGVMFAAIWSDTLHAYDDPKSWQAVRQGQMLREWCRLCPRVFIYGYLYDMLASGLSPVPNTRKLARNFPLMKKWGVFGFYDEGRYVWMEEGIATHYLRAHLEWNADADAKALLDDLFTTWYGPAAKPARAFWDALEDAIESTPMLGHEDRIMPFVYSDQLVATLKKHLADAEALAADETTRLRVKVDRLILEHLEGYRAMQAAEFAADFPEAVRQIDRMMECRRQLNAISPFFCRPDERRYDSGVYYWGVLDRKPYYQDLADRLSGAKGDRVAILPDQAAFTTDPTDAGRFAQWYRPETDVRQWKKVSTTRPFYLNGLMAPDGYPYMGPLWYRLEVNVPAAFQGKPVRLYIPTVDTEAWLWVNGLYVGYRPYIEAYVRPNDMDLDVTSAIQPGKVNVFVLRVHTGRNAAQAADGMLSRAFLYSPKAAPATP